MNKLLFMAIVFALFTSNGARSQPLSNYDHIPVPVPYDWNQCTLVLWTNKGRSQGIDGRVGELRPPIAKDDLALLEYWRREGWAKLQLCEERSS